MCATSSSDQAHIAVIGAGIAGLTAALRLVGAGHRVTVLERHAAPGGKMRTIPSAAGPIDAGPTVLTLRGVFDALFASVGERVEDHIELIPLTTLARHFWPDGSQLDLFADEGANRDAVSAFAGEDAAKQFDAFCKRTRRLFEAFDAPMMQAPVPHLASLTAHVLRQPSLIPAMAPLSSLRSVLKQSFNDPRLAQLFGRYATYVGGAPHRAPAILSLIWQAEAQGVWTPRGGMHAFARAIADLATSKGAEFSYGAHVARISMESGRIDAVHLEDGTKITCDGIVHAGDPRALAAGGLGAAVTGIASQTLTLPRSYSARVHSFAATPCGPDLSFHNVFFDQDPMAEFDALERGEIPQDPTLYICALDRAEGTPPDLERFEIISNAPASAAADQPEELEQWHLRTMQTMQTHFGMSFSPIPSPQSVTTPQTFARMFPHSLGALYGQSPHGLMAAFQRPTARTKIPGLYLAGGGTHPGAGVPMAARSGLHAAEAILNDRISTSQSNPTAMRGGMSTA
ncbi:MAG: 1-hydroxycarotenoid 3,4-desaturase CrtD [Pseudomonadota bacterium]